MNPKLLILMCFLCFGAKGQQLYTPVDNAFFPSKNVALEWKSNNSQTVFEVQVSTDSIFQNVFFNQTVTGNILMVTNHQLNTTYFWRIRDLTSSTWSSFRKYTPFSLKLVEGIKLWLSSDTLVSLSSSGGIDMWGDKNLLNDAVQNNLNLRPVLVDNQVNGKPLVRFDGINDYFSINEITDIRSVFWVLRERLGATPNFRSLLGHDNFYYFHRGFELQIFNNYGVMKSVLDGSMYLNRRKIDPLNVNMPNQLSLISLTTTGNVVANNISFNNLPDRVWDGDWAEIIILNKPLSTQTRLMVESYLQHKYSPNVYLGKDTVLTQNICKTVLKAPKGQKRYKWSTGEVLDSLVVSNPGLYSVTVTGIFDNQSIDSIQISYSDFPYLFNDTSLCSNVQSLVWDTKLTTSGYNISWLKNSILDGSVSSYQITTSGIYTLSITGLIYGCNLTKTISVSSDNFPSLITVSDTSLCQNTQLKVNYPISNIKSYLWNGIATNSSFQATTSGGYSLKTVNQNNCTNNTFFNVSITGIAPTVNFTSSLPFDTVCTNAPVIFNNFSSLPNGVTISGFRWDFGNGLTNIIIWTPQTTTYTSAGSYFVTLSVLGNNGCFNSATKKIVALNNPVASFSVLPSLRCQKDTILFYNNSLPNNVGVPLSSYNWNFGVSTAGSLNISTSPNGKFIYGNFGTYTASFTVSNKYGCSNNSKQLVSIAASPSSDFTFTKGCLGTPISFVDITQNPTGTFTQTRNWDFGNGSTSNTVNNTISYSTIGQYPVTVKVTNNLGCISTSKKTIIVKNAPIPIIKYGPVCKNNLVQLYDSSTIIGDTIVNWQWQIGNSISSTLKNPKVLMGDTGNYQVSLTVGTKSCSVSMARPEIVKVNGLPVVSFSTLPDFGSPPLTVTLTSSLTGISNWKWNLGNSTLTSVNALPLTVVYSDSGVYPIKLIVSNQNGCSDSLIKSIIVSKPIIDLAVSDLGVLSNNGIQSISVMLTNKGNIPIKGISLKLKSKEGFELVENTNLELSPSASHLYSFTSQIPVNTTKYPFYCVDAYPISLTDSKTENNTSCKLISNDFYVGLPFPNPTSGDTYLPISLSKGDDVTISLVDIAGKQSASMVYKFPDNGYEAIQLPTSVISSGVYLIFISMKDQIIIRKLIKY